MPALAVGDIVFIRVPFRPFLEVAAATQSWANHVGIVVEIVAGEARVAESTFPFARVTPFARFVARSQHRAFVVARLVTAPDPAQAARIRTAARRRLGTFYDTGFDLDSPRQFCSRFVHEVLDEAMDVRVGSVMTFAELHASHPDADLRFWRAWFFGRIPWRRRTVTPQSLLDSTGIDLIFDNRTPNCESR
ncbi:YebB family permuted papain-like enzyme [Paraburkholderia acidisoli]|uniref:YebB family permuted papain-like enzyme n=2 Tax=Paraburkholderia acidisoli TaxID=2571748 RepID=A0A7Z2JIL6_9BURK|nr:YebB family permuted papain-like enzyme [Paraburkholderia acidisoli]